MSQLRQVKCDKCGYEDERFVDVGNPGVMTCPNCSDGLLLVQFCFNDHKPPVFAGQVSENPDSPNYVRPDQSHPARELLHTYRKIEAKETEGRIERLRPDKAKLEEKLIKRHIERLAAHYGDRL